MFHPLLPILPHAIAKLSIHQGRRAEYTEECKRRRTLKEAAPKDTWWALGIHFDASMPWECRLHTFIFCVWLAALLKANEIWVLEEQSNQCPYPLQAVLRMPHHLLDMGIEHIRYYTTHDERCKAKDRIVEMVRMDCYYPLYYFHLPKNSIWATLAWWRKSYQEVVSLERIQQVPMLSIQKKVTHQRLEHFVERTRKLFYYHERTLCSECKVKRGEVDRIALDARWGCIAQALAADEELNADLAWAQRIEMIDEVCRMINRSEATRGVVGVILGLFFAVEVAIIIGIMIVVVARIVVIIVVIVMGVVLFAVEV